MRCNYLGSDTIFYRRAHGLSIITEMASWINGDYSGLNSPNIALFTVASQTPAVDFVAVNRIRSMMMSHFASIWQKYPGLIIATPVAPTVGAEIVESHLQYG